MEEYLMNAEGDSELLGLEWENSSLRHFKVKTTL